MPAKDTIIALVQGNADASGSQDLRIGLGNSALGPILVRGETRPTGRAYVAPSATDALLSGIGAYLDALAGTSTQAWARIQTNGPGVAPTVLGGGRISVASKNEGTNELTVTFAPAYTAAPAVAAFLVNHSLLYSLDLVSSGPASAVFLFRDGLSAPLSINSRTLYVLAGGAA